ncbi:ABC transporter permease subunit [Brevibacillus sp. B_LB10_24]|uniref:ABC transporter permease subunit n=1 Tax=Brevibacillus sp. B_LB10_24 TaxID=3380645 RepID=UPI0038B966E8
MNQQKSPSPFQVFLQKFLRQRFAVISLIIILGIIAVAVLAPWLVPYDPYRPVTDQYAAKGIKAGPLTSASVKVEAVMSDGTVKRAEELGQLKLDSDDRQIASARKAGEYVIVNANGDGATTILLSAGEAASRFKVVVSGTDNGQAYVSQLIADVPQHSLELGDEQTAAVKAVLTDGTELSGLNEITAYIEKNAAMPAVKPAANDGFGNTRVSSDSRGLTFTSLQPDVVQAGSDGAIKAVGAGETAVKVSLDGVSALIPLAVNQPLSKPIVTKLVPGELTLDLINLYKHQPPSGLHLFGTDHQNRDIFSRVLVGTRETLLIGFVSVSIGAAVGTLLGLLAGYYGRWLDALIMRCTDVLLAFPGILLAIAVIALLGPGIVNIIFAVAVFTVPIFTRIVRGSTLSLKQMTYVEAAKSIGVKDRVILMRHIFPGTLSIVMVYLTMRIGTAILIGASLSFLGLGGDITAPEWGAMLSAAKDNSRNLFHPTFFPGLAIVVTVLSFNLLGDGLRDALDPKLKD